MSNITKRFVQWSAVSFLGMKVGGKEEFHFFKRSLLLRERKPKCGSLRIHLEVVIHVSLPPI